MESRMKVWIGVALLLTLIIGIIGGGVAGGGVAYILARQQLASASVSSAAPQFVANTQQAVQATPVPAATQPTAAVPANVASADAPVVAAVQRVSPAVVTVINTLQEGAQPDERLELPFPLPDQGPQEREPRATGSGVIISEDGYIITNNHVIEGQRSLAVTFADGSRRDAQLVGTDPLNDLAVLKVEGEMPGVAVLGDSEALQPGETAIAIGSPLGNFKNTVTVGVVSAINRSVAFSGLEGLVQTDAPINSGNSGGPLVNIRGEIIGINTLVVRGNGFSGANAEGLGFAVASNTVRMVSDQIIATGQVIYPYLGVQYRMIDPDIAAEDNLPVQNGALIQSLDPNEPAIVPGTPADDAGLRDGDIITAIDGEALDAETSLRQLLMQRKPGDTVQLDVQRNNDTLTLDVTLGTRPEEE
jgi:2-alkenal reductase